MKLRQSVLFTSTTNKPAAAGLAPEEAAAGEVASGASQDAEPAAVADPAAADDAAADGTAPVLSD